MTRGAEQAPDGVAAWVRAASAPMTAAQQQAGLQAVTFRLEQDRRRRVQPGRRLLVALACAGAVAGAVALGLPRLARGPGPSDAQPLTFVVEGGAIGDGGYVLSETPSGARVRFSEGTEVHLLPGARGRLGRVDATGARFAIEQGAAEVSVTPRPGARWLVDAGPFLITVRGTVFTAAWDAGGERLDIDMKKGRVSVTGPVAEGEVSVRAGQHLAVNVPRKEVVLREGEARVPASDGVTSSGDDGGGASGWAARGTSPPPAHAPVERDRGGSSAEPGVRGRLGDRGRSWTAWLAAGELDRVLADAERRGVGTVLAQAPEAELAALADAARYRRRGELARRALLAERARFPRSSRARDAAFLLGRIEEDRSGGGPRALEWYDRYLEEAPTGAFASEALGRKMTATDRTRGVEPTRAVAREYLRRFPEGSYANAARAFVERP